MRCPTWLAGALIAAGALGLAPGVAQADPWDPLPYTPQFTSSQICALYNSSEGLAKYYHTTQREASISVLMQYYPVSKDKATQLVDAALADRSGGCRR
jgi:hypothetical protein